MSRGPLPAHSHKQNSVSLSFPISDQHPLSPTTYPPSFFYSPRSIGPVTTCTACFSLHAESPTPKLAQPSVTVSPTYTASGTNPGSTFPPTKSSPLDLLVPRSGVSTNFSLLSSVAPDPAATSSASSSDSFSSSKSFEASIPGTSTTGHGLSQSTTTTGGDSASQSSEATDPPTSSTSSTSFNFTSSLFTSLSVLPLPLSLSSTVMSTGNSPTTSSTPGLSSSSPSPISTPLVPVPITSLNISTSVSTSNTLVSSTSSTTSDPLSSSHSMTTITLPQSTSFDPSPSLSSFTTPSTTDSDPGSTSSVDVIPGTPTNSLRHESTITATRVFTSTLPGGKTTVISTVVESRVLSTSDPVIGSRFSHSTGAIIGVAVSATVGLILSVLVVFLSCARYRSREEQNRRRRQQQRRNWSAFGRKFGGRDLPPIPSGPIPTSGSRSRRDRLDSSANILSIRTPEIEYEEDKVWRPPLADDDETDIGNEGVALGELVRGASPTRPGYEYGYGFGDIRHDDATGVGGSELPTPPESGEDGKGKSSHGHSQSPAHTSNGHGYGHRRIHVHIHAPGDRGVGVESALLPPGPALPPPVVDSGIIVPAQTPHPVYGYLPVIGYPEPTYGLGVASVGSAPAEVPPKVSGFGSYMGIGHEREVHAATAAVGRDVEGAAVSSENGRESRRTQRDSILSGETVKGAGVLVTPRTSQGEDLSHSSGDGVHNVSELGRTSPEDRLERGTGSRSSRGTTSKVESSSTRSMSLKEVLNRFRTLVPSVQVTPDARPGRRNSKDGPSFLGSGGSAMSGTVFGTVNGGPETRPGYDYGALVRPHQRQIVLERHMDAAGNGLAPPAPVVLVNHAAGMHFPIGPPPELVITSYPSVTAGLLSSEAATRVNGSLGPSHPFGRSREEIDNEDDSLYARNSVVRDKLLDPYFLSPGGGSSPNIEGASLRDYVDYSRRIGGTVKNHLMSTTTFDTVDQDSVSVSVGTLS